mmetsp:Transcript_16650/g.34851  ORF Transcript_16650/g.34851 Transcript_16650/m.34851 type:complete len:755 (+) Transcript_16650:78-2342(+)
MGDNSNHQFIIPTPISKTALDSLHSKLSAIDAGWLDGGHDACENAEGFGSRTPTVHHPIEWYARLLRQINDGLSEAPVKSNNDEANNVVQVPKARRQTPLVNAGYAARMAIMTYILERWLDLVVNNIMSRSPTEDSSSSESNGIRVDKSCHATVNVVVLGCGMDALGIWSKHLLQGTIKQQGHNPNDKNAPKIKVYEFDAWDNCILKRKALITSSMLRNSFNEDGTTNKRGLVTSNNKQGGEAKSLERQPFSIVCQGEIISCNNHSHEMEGRGEEEQWRKLQKENQVDYNLVALDLRLLSEKTPQNYESDRNPKSVLSLASKATEMDTSQPTIILSELVLAYLGRDGANSVLRSISNDILGTHECSMFACLEPIFPLDIEKECRYLSVEQSYSVQYGKQFSSKLQRGNSKEENYPDSSWFHPLASDRYTLHRRLQNDCGFPTSHVISYASLREAVIHVSRLLRGSGVTGSSKSVLSKVGSQFLLSKEPFDEHTALTLNLKSYGIVCVAQAFGPGMECKLEFPSWMKDVCPWSEGFRNVDGLLTKLQLNTIVQIHPIKTPSEDEQVRILFGETYKDFYRPYPGIRKCVMSALKGDLSSGVTECDNIEKNQHSLIRARYVRNGGEFWVAVVPTIGAVEKVVGCVGIRPKKMKNDGIDFDSSQDVVKAMEYEVFRLVVDDTQRGKGIGKSLLQLAQDFAVFQSIGKMRRCVHLENCVKIWAVTAQFFVEANKLYEADEFVCYERDGLLNSYCKTIIL